MLLRTPSIRFSDLNVHIVLDILKYLVFKDRIRLERVSRTFRTFLNQIWHEQKSLAIRYVETLRCSNLDNPCCRMRYEKCCIEDHEFEYSDIVLIPDVRTKGGLANFEYIRRLIQKCPN